jgi:predicted dehydrogenase
MPSRTGYAVVGLGHIAQVAVLPAFRHAKSSTLTAVVSGDRAKAKSLARKFRAPEWYTYDEYERCLSSPRVEAVFVATPNGAHAEYAVRAAQRGKHVLCEKPMANTVEDCRRMIEACQTAGVRLMIAYRKYFDPASLALKRLVTEGRLGHLRAIHSGFTIQLREGQAPAWRYDPRLAGGGSLMDLGVYCVNTIRWLTGLEPLQAEAYRWATAPERFRDVDESMAFRLVFPEGLVAQATSSFTAAQSSFLRLNGEKGWASLDPAFAYNEERRLFGKIGRRWFQRRFELTDEFALELDAFAHCIQLHVDPEPSGYQGLRDVAVMESIYRAADAGHAVAIPAPGREA